jgi:hypothetical protein
MATGTISLAIALRDDCFIMIGVAGTMESTTRREVVGASTRTGIRYNIPTSCFELLQGSKQVAP